MYLKSKVSKFIAIVLIMSFIFTLAACGSQNTSGNNNTPSTNSGNENTAATELKIPTPIMSDKKANIKDFSIYKKPEQGKKMTFALLLFSRGFEWMIGFEYAFKDTCKELGIETIVCDAQGSDEKQLNQIQDMITKKVDGIILLPNSDDGEIAGVKAANDAGILLVTSNGKVNEGIVPFRTEWDNFAAGKLAAEYVAKKIGGKGAVLETRGGLASSQATGRHEGFLEGMKAYPDIKVIAKNTEWVSDEANKATVDQFTMDPNTKAVYSNNDEMQTGIQAGLASIGKLVNVGEANHVVLVGIDGTPLALDRIRQGIQDASCVQDPFEEGKLITQFAYDFLMGKDVPELTKTQPYIVDKSTATDSRLWGNQAGKLK